VLGPFGAAAPCDSLLVAVQPNASVATASRATKPP
jgi:hypothetical protein